MHSQVFRWAVQPNIKGSSRVATSPESFMFLHFELYLPYTSPKLNRNNQGLSSLLRQPQDTWMLNRAEAEMSMKRSTKSPCTKRVANNSSLVSCLSLLHPRGHLAADLRSPTTTLPGTGGGVAWCQTGTSRVGYASIRTGIGKGHSKLAGMG